MRGAKKLCEKIHHNDGAVVARDNETFMSSLGWSSCTRVEVLQPHIPTHRQVAAETCSEFGREVAQEAASSLCCGLLWNMVTEQKEEKKEEKKEKKTIKASETKKSRPTHPRPVPGERTIPDVISVDNSLIETNDDANPTVKQDVDIFAYPGKNTAEKPRNQSSSEKMDSKRRHSHSQSKKRHTKLEPKEDADGGHKKIDDELIVQKNDDKLPDLHKDQLPTFDTSDQIVTTCICDIPNGHFERKIMKIGNGNSGNKQPRPKG